MMIYTIQIVPTLAPEYGGPTRAVSNLSLALAELGVNVTLLFADIGDRYQPPIIPSHQNLKCISLPARIVVGLRPGWIPGFRRTLMDLCAGKDQVVIHDYGIWLPHNGVVAEVSQTLNIPLLIAPTGMLQPWSFSYRRWRKLIAWNLWQKNRIKKADLIHAASSTEAQNLKQFNLGIPVVILPNGISLPDWQHKRSLAVDGKKKLLFMSRLHPGKGLINLIEAFKMANPVDWELIIAGYDENNYQKELEVAVVAAGLSNSIKFIGPIGNEAKWQLYAESDVFVLPSFSENFGMVVAEALASELPVITTNGTPWTDLMTYNCGWYVDPTVPALAGAIQEAVNLTDEERREMGSRGRNLIQQKYTCESIAVRALEVYKKILSGEISGDQGIIDV